MLGAPVRNLVLFLIAFIAVVTFMRAFDKTEAETLHNLPAQAAIEGNFGK